MCRNEFFSILFYISNLHFINISITKKEMFFDLSHTIQKKKKQRYRRNTTENIQQGQRGDALVF